jgi:hypothetical protein
MAVTLAVTAAGTSPACCRLVSSAHNFRQSFQDLGKSNSGILERLVFSLALSNSKTPKAEAGSEAAGRG